MLDCVLYRTGKDGAARFYRVEIALDLFAQVTVRREWGIAGGRPRQAMRSYGNLRQASSDADRHRDRALRCGYVRAA